MKRILWNYLPGIVHDAIYRATGYVIVMTVNVEEWDGKKRHVKDATYAWRKWRTAV